MKLSQDVLLGLFFSIIGAVSAWIAWSYPFGTSSRMGPGYFPIIVSSLLLLTGLLVLLRARLTGSEAIPTIRWRPLVLVPVAILIFGLVMENLGLPLAVFLLVVLSATASVKFRFGWKAFAGSVAFAGLCSVVFVELLGLPIPIIGNWLQGLGF